MGPEVLSHTYTLPLQLPPQLASVLRCPSGLASSTTDWGKPLLLSFTTWAHGTISLSFHSPYLRL